MMFTKEVLLDSVIHTLILEKRLIPEKKNEGYPINLDEEYFIDIDSFIKSLKDNSKSKLNDGLLIGSIEVIRDFYKSKYKETKDDYILDKVTQCNKILNGQKDLITIGRFKDFIHFQLNDLERVLSKIVNNTDVYTPKKVSEFINFHILYTFVFEWLNKEHPKFEVININYASINDLICS